MGFCLRILKFELLLCTLVIFASDYKSFSFRTQASKSKKNLHEIIHEISFHHLLKFVSSCENLSIGFFSERNLKVEHFFVFQGLFHFVFLHICLETP